MQYIIHSGSRYARQKGGQIHVSETKGPRSMHHGIMGPLPGEAVLGSARADGRHEEAVSERHLGPREGSHGGVGGVP